MNEEQGGTLYVLGTAQPGAARRPLVLLGPMGAGKSRLAPSLAKVLGGVGIDVDAVIEQETGSSIEELFEGQGEAVFRQMELAALDSALGATGESSSRAPPLRAGQQHTDLQRVIAAGGGTMCSLQAWRRLRASGAYSAYLKVSPVEASERVAGSRRPLLKRAKTQEERAGLLSTLQEARAGWYELADFSLETTGHTPEALLARLQSEFEGLAESTIPVNCGEESYRVTLVEKNGAAAWTEVARRIEKISSLPRPPEKIAIVADRAVFALHGEGLRDALEQAGFTVCVSLLPSGEAAKSWQVLGETLDGLLASGLRRDDLVLGFGGGAATDLAGLAASLLYRGLRLIQLPSSLLAMLDASVGGKTAIDHALGKNLIGSFYQPTEVILSLQLLSTLPERERASALGEVIKVALLQGEEGLRWLESLPSALEGLPWKEILLRCVKQKAEIVGLDPKEEGLRRVLNLGHTAGHAFEHLSQGALRHGEAVGLGLLAAARVGEHLARSDRAFVWSQLEERTGALLKKWGLPSDWEGRLSPQIFDQMAIDKKASQKNIRWVVPTPEGPRVVSLTSDRSRSILEATRR